jgi:hypothetical protein
MLPLTPRVKVMPAGLDVTRPSDWLVPAVIGGPLSKSVGVNTVAFCGSGQRFVILKSSSMVKSSLGTKSQERHKIYTTLVASMLRLGPYHGFGAGPCCPGWAYCLQCSWFVL